MAKILLVGIDPALVDFTDPSLPPGVTAEMIRQGLVTAVAELTGAGHSVEQMFVPPDPADLGAFGERLARGPVDCVIIGGGVCVPLANRPLFEALLNRIGRADPTPAIALVLHPGESAEAVARVLGPPGA